MKNNLSQVVERLRAVKSGADIADVYGKEWCFNAGTSFRVDLSTLLDAIEARGEQEEQRCSYCDGSGDVHRIDGEWLGPCPEGCPIPAEARPDRTDDRFFVDHGMIHDRQTGRHVTTAPDDETWNGGTISDCLQLLNGLAALQARHLNVDQAVAAERERCVAVIKGIRSGVGVELAIDRMKRAILGHAIAAIRAVDTGKR